MSIFGSGAISGRHFLDGVSLEFCCMPEATSHCIGLLLLLLTHLPGLGPRLKQRPLAILGMNVPLNLLAWLDRLFPYAAYVRRARVCSLYRQGAGTCNQAQVADVLTAEFRQRVRPCSYDWMPHLDLGPSEDLCIFDLQCATETWNVLQKRLKKGNSLARASRPG